MKNNDLEQTAVEMSDDRQEESLLKTLGRFADYTTPAMKELLSYGKDKLKGASSGPI